MMGEKGYGEKERRRITKREDRRRKGKERRGDSGRKG